jgi:hypothetical protein
VLRDSKVNIFVLIAMTFEASRRKQVLVLQPKGKALYEGELLAVL